MSIADLEGIAHRVHTLGSRDLPGPEPELRHEVGIQLEILHCSQTSSCLTTIVLKRYYHVGVAVATDRGLLVPVIRDAARFVNLIRDLLADPESFTLAV
jgi:hypothetical protein